jgi:PAS domain-containing protein
VVCIHHDVTERVAAETEVRALNQSLEQRIAERTAELRASEARARTLVEHAPEAIVVFDGESGRFLECNEHACRLFGLSASPMAGPRARPRCSTSSACSPARPRCSSGRTGTATGA